MTQKYQRSTSEGLVDMTQEEIDQYEKGKVEFWLIEADMLRQLRNQKLAESDGVLMKCMELGTQLPTEWATYRQELRDLPNQEGFPENIVWPIKPE